MPYRRRPEASAQDEILHRGLGCRHRITIHRHHRVEGERQQFQTDIDRDKMVRRNHHHHAQGGKKRQSVILALGHLLALEDIAPRIEQNHHHRQIKKQLQQVSHQIADIHIAEGVADFTRTHRKGDHCRADQGQLGSDESCCALPVLGQEIKHEDQASHQQDEDLRSCDAKVRRQELHFGKSHSGYQLLDLAEGDVTQQLIDRAVHDFSKGLRIETHAQCADGEEDKDQ
jgi:hypothetical protein